MKSIVKKIINWFGYDVVFRCIVKNSNNYLKLICFVYVFKLGGIFIDLVMCE